MSAIAPLWEDVVPAGLISELEALPIDHLGVEITFGVRKPTIRVTACRDRQRKQIRAGDTPEGHRLHNEDNSGYM